MSNLTKQEEIEIQIKVIEDFLTKDKLLESDYYKMYRDALRLEDLSYIIGVIPNTENGYLIRSHIKQLNELYKI